MAHISQRDQRDVESKHTGKCLPMLIPWLAMDGDAKKKLAYQLFFTLHVPQ